MTKINISGKFTNENHSQMQELDSELKIVLDFFIYDKEQKYGSREKSQLLMDLVKEYIPSLGPKFQEKFENFGARTEYAYRQRKDGHVASENSAHWFLSFLKDLVITVNINHSSVSLMHNFICISLVLSVAKRFLSDDQLDDLRWEMYQYMSSYIHETFSGYIETSGGFQAILENRKNNVSPRNQPIGFLKKIFLGFIVLVIATLYFFLFLRNQIIQKITSAYHFVRRLMNTVFNYLFG